MSVRSLRFESINSDDVTQSNAPPATSTFTYTVNFWVKRKALLQTGGLVLLADFYAGTGLYVAFVNDDTIYADLYSGSTLASALQTVGKIQDTTLWHNIHVMVDTTRPSTAGSRFLLYVDNVQTSSAAPPAQNTGVLNTGTWHIGGARSQFGDYEIDLFYYCDGSYFGPSSFIDTTTMKPIPFTGSFGIRGFLLDFENNTSLTTLGTDTSGNGNNAVLSSGFTLADSILDSPSLVAIQPNPFSASGTLAADSFVHSHLITGNAASLSAAGALLADGQARMIRKDMGITAWGGAAALAASASQTRAAYSLLAGSGGLGAALTVNIDPHSARALLAGSGGLAVDTFILTTLQRYSLDIVNRVKRLIPTRWFAFVAPYRDAVLGGLADVAAWSRYLIDYDRRQSRLATASDIWLDIFCYDYLRRHLLRSGASDDVFRAKIRATILQERVTRNGMTNAITTLVGVAPKIIEPWNTGDCGAYDMPNWGYGLAGAWGSIQLPGQVFMKISRSGVGPTGVPNVGGYDFGIGGYGAGSIEYVGSAISQIGITDQDIYDIINTAKPTGVTAWTQIGP